MLTNAGQLFDVFDDDDINSLLSILNHLPDAKNSNDDSFRAYTNGFTPSDIVYAILKKKFFNKIENKLGILLNVRCGMHLKELIPWSIHTDYNHQYDSKYQSAPGLAILIPLKVVGPESKMTHTVIFNEYCKTNFLDYVQNSTPLINHSKHIHEEHCGHICPENLEYVSLNGVYAWKPGSIIYWDRKLLHSSDNFLKNSITEKQALVLFC